MKFCSPKKYPVQLINRNLSQKFALLNIDNSNNYYNSPHRNSYKDNMYFKYMNNLDNGMDSINRKTSNIVNYNYNYTEGHQVNNMQKFYKKNNMIKFYNYKYISYQNNKKFNKCSNISTRNISKCKNLRINKKINKKIYIYNNTMRNNENYNNNNIYEKNSIIQGINIENIRQRN